MGKDVFLANGKPMMFHVYFKYGSIGLCGKCEKLEPRV